MAYTLATATEIGGLAGQAQYGSTVNQLAPKQTGIATVLQELVSEVNRTVELSYKAKAALGIACPPTEGTENKTSSLIDVLNSLRARLYRANNEFEEVAHHINS
jgi:hypothetical protein